MADRDDSALQHRIAECFVKAVGIIRKRRGGDDVDDRVGEQDRRRDCGHRDQPKGPSFESRSGLVFGFMPPSP
jgi:hypothetical protein